MNYQFALLDPRPGADNSAYLGPQTLGIEVTIPALAAGCGLGNIDPQHSGGEVGLAAIEAALLAKVPPVGSMLVTVRADLDSVGAMTVINWMANEDARTPNESFNLIRLIAEADKEASGSWPGPRPIGVAEDFVGELSVINHIVTDHSRSLEERVLQMQDFLILFYGSTPDRNPPIWEEYRSRLLAEAQQALDGLDARVEGGMAVVVGNHRLAMGLGYRLAPVVVASNPSFRFQGGHPHVKHTVARWNSTVAMDWDGLKATLSWRESGWGGSPSILGSPQGVGSSLTTEEVVKLVQKFLPEN